MNASRHSLYHWAMDPFKGQMYGVYCKLFFPAPQVIP